ncbi:adrenocortical dysplasia protein homolog isoform X2 [Scyliorhinus torazame]|uniref:adrenocortical dysplasia protein homolog isoform X2 n=1 Tax=Scyliorhinus torazame TaxID=75743 RepID=UPI003B5ACBB2
MCALGDGLGPASAKRSDWAWLRDSADNTYLPTLSFVLPENWIKEAEYDEPAAVVHVSDLKHYIKAVVTKEAKRDLEQEEENYTFSDIKNKIVILRKFNVELRLELQLEACEFYLVVQELKILPAETFFFEACSCNLDPAVQKKLREFWQNHMNNMTEQTGSFSGLCLSNLIAAVEDEDNSLKSAVELCLDLTDSCKASTSTSSYLLPSIHPPTGWKTSSRKNTNKINIFTIPEAMLMISSNQEEVLNNIKEWKDDFVCTEDADSEVEHNGDTDTSLNNADGQEAASSQNPWNEVLPVRLAGTPSSGETYFSCASEPCKKHFGECDGQLPSTFSDSPAYNKKAIEHQFLNSSTQDPEKSLQLYTDSSQQEQSHSEELCVGNPSHTPNTPADNRLVRTDVAEPEELPVNNIEKSLNHSRTACTRLFKNISPLSVAANSYSNLNCVGPFKNIAPVPSTTGGSHTNQNGGPNTEAQNCSTVAGNYVLEVGEQQLNQGEDEEPYEILRAGKRKRQFVDSEDEPAEDEPDGNRVEPGTSNVVNGNQNSSDVSSDETFIGTDNFEEITNDVCQMNTIAKRDKSCRKHEAGRNAMFKETDLRSVTENTITMVSRKYNKLDFASERPCEQVSDCRRQTSSEASIVQPTADVSAGMKHALSPNAKQDKVKPLRHPDGSQFLYNYPAPTDELISQVNSVRVPSGLLKWAVSYLTRSSLTQD